MGDVEIAIDDVDAVGGRLQGLDDELAKPDAHADDDTAHLAHGKVVSAMENFRGNWDDNRDHLADKLGKLGELAKTAAQSFSDADEELARNVRAIMEDR